MTNENDREINDLLRETFTSADHELKHDLWPAMLCRLDEARGRPLPWYDWALFAGVGVWILAAPQGFLHLLYHL